MLSNITISKEELLQTCRVSSEEDSRCNNNSNTNNSNSSIERSLMFLVEVFPEKLVVTCRVLRTSSLNREDKLRVLRTSNSKFSSSKG